MKKPNKTTWLITLVCVILAFFTVKALEGQKTEMEIGGVTSLQTIKKLMDKKKDLEQRREEYDQIIKMQVNELAQYENRAADKSMKLQQMQKEVQETRLAAGLLPVEGPGIEIILNDRKRDSFLNTNLYMMNYFIVHDSDMLHVINELRGAGAEAIAINGTRIMATSRISCGGPTINVGKSERFAPPFVIHAIGDPDALMAGFQREDSIYHDLIAWGLEFQIRRMESIEIPRYLGEIEFTYAEAIQEDE
ncbi:MAG: DUF881 domain-containing protein [Caldicoprobacterales bacterium]|jgi:uncharacterized protein YlxW (UPF0749 family)|nr:DUF881 domain-containing protein [Clostridiales bacterium]